MNARGFLKALFFLTLFWLVPAQVRAVDEKGRIEGLILHIEGLKDAKFLRVKWEAKEKKIKTADDFIKKAAMVSGTTGKPFLIKFSDGREVKCGEYLSEQLKKP
jgi:hypothetical protein